MANNVLRFEFLKEEPTITPMVTEDRVVNPNMLQVLPNRYETKRNNRWVVNLPTEMGIEPWLIASTSRPKLRYRSEHIQGGYAYQPIWIKFRDPIGPSTTQKLWTLQTGINTNPEFIDEQVNNIRNDFENIRENGLTYTLELLDPTGIVIERWTIEEAKILEFDFGDSLDYSNDGDVTCGIKIIPKNVVLHF
jgi:hypothetical protein